MVCAANFCALLFNGPPTTATGLLLSLWIIGLAGKSLYLLLADTYQTNTTIQSSGRVEAIQLKQRTSKEDLDFKRLAATAIRIRFRLFEFSRASCLTLTA